MKYFIFRNYTVELFFDNLNAEFSGYEDISYIDEFADRFIWCYMATYKFNEELIAKEIDSYANMLQVILKKIKHDKLIIAFTIRRLYNINYETSNIFVENSINSYNNKLRSLEIENPNIKIVDIAEFYNNYSKNELLDWKFYFTSQIPWNPKLSEEFKQWFKGQIDAIQLIRKKCLVLDLDNTLWSGILGEDGIEGIKIGGDYPGNVFLFFQQSILELWDNGIILAICSKNNEDDVLELWNKHPNLLLKKDHFVTYRINWNNKADNILEIANELNLGLDSFVFIDDNPTERELVKQAFPSISVPEFPDKPYKLPNFIKKLVDSYFKTYKLTIEDFNKTQQYRENILRTQLVVQFSNFDDYLRSLEIVLQIKQSDNFNIARLAQMSQKTNQFNLTTHRYTDADILSISNAGGQIYGLQVKDKFGDNGLTGMIIIKFENEIASIDSFLLSCRILGKKIETVFLKYILMKLKENGIKIITAQYIRTDKNKHVQNYYDDFGFILKSNTHNEKYYTLNLENINYTISNNYTLEEK